MSGSNDDATVDGIAVSGPEGEGASGGEGGEARQRRRDDLLEAMYWLAGEGIADEPSPGELAPLLGADVETLRPILEALVEDRWIEPVGDGTYRLTGEGELEAARRFADSFSDMAGKQGHGACDDDCDCHTSAEAAEECATERTSAHAHP